MRSHEPVRPRPLVDVKPVREISLAISAAHLFIYLVPETADEAAALGVTDRGPSYFAFRSAAMGPVPWEVTLAAFYNFSPRAVRSMTGVWDVASPSGRPRASGLPGGRCGASVWVSRPITLRRPGR